MTSGIFHFMKTKLVILFLFFCSGLSAQQEIGINSGLLVRGKVMGGFFVEDVILLNATLGLEYRFLRNFSMGADFVHINEIYEEEHYYDSTDWTKYNEYAQKNPRTCLLTDIRFYPFQKVFNYSPFKPYIAAFSKLGNIKTWCVPGYVFSSNDMVRRKGTFYDLGITAGVHMDFGRGGIDFNIGYCKRFETANIEYFETDGTNRFVENESSIKDRLAGRLNLYFFLFTKNRDVEQ